MSQQVFEQPAASAFESGDSVRIVLTPHVPRAVGLGSSAAAAVAIIRALSQHFGLELDDRKVNRIACESKRIVHGMPSEIDNTVATYAKPIRFIDQTAAAASADRSVSIR